jgi:hypothetical protein
MKVTTIVLINGFWITALSWEVSVKHYGNKGYSVMWSLLKLAFSGRADHKVQSLTVNQFHHALRAHHGNRHRSPRSSVTLCRLRNASCRKLRLRTAIQFRSVSRMTRGHLSSLLPAAMIEWHRARWSKQISIAIANRRPAPITKNSRTKPISRFFGRRTSLTTCSVGRSVVPMGQNWPLFQNRPTPGRFNSQSNEKEM